MSQIDFLPGVAVQHVLDRLAKAGGNEVSSGKFGSPESSAALAGAKMVPFETMRDALRAGRETFQFLDATQLVKHAFGLVTDGKRKAKAPSLVYLYAEPAALGTKPIPPAAHRQHREEIAHFADAVSGAEVGFHAIRYRDWLASWPAPPNEVGTHGHAVIQKFAP